MKMHPTAFLFTGMTIWKNWADKKRFFKQAPAKQRTSY